MSSKSKLPPFGNLLVQRQQFDNLPWMSFVCTGAGAWNNAKVRNQRGDSVAMVLPPRESPNNFKWPVSGLMTVIEWSQGPSVDQVVELARALLRDGAESVTIWPRWVDYSNPNLEWPTEKPPIKTYRVNRSREVVRAA